MGEIKPACRFGRVERQDFDFPHNLVSVHENLTYNPVGGMVDKRTHWVARRLHLRESQVDEHQIGLLACGDAAEIVGSSMHWRQRYELIRSLRRRGRPGSVGPRARAP